MIFYQCTGDLKGKHGDPMEVGKAIFNFFLWQNEQAISEEIAARSRLRSAEAANLAAHSEYERENMGVGSHFSLPYKESDFVAMRREAEKTATNRIEAKAMMNFVRDRLLEKFVEVTNPKV